MIKLFIYTQKVTDARDPKNVKTWDKYKASYQKHTFDIILTKDLHNRLDYELKQEKLVMPILMTLDDTQYFTKKRRYTRKDGTEAMKTVIVISDYVALEQTEFETKTLDDIVAELDKEE